ncbi:MAG: polysulfide reductase NrfD [Ignavibacteriae bacterium]|nr:polysulfide reductase NrfD [Ignavibacteriota bacterium]MCB9257753.1 polysulfide reductase NrfD [Ignavibacteriales bacterium]
MLEITTTRHNHMIDPILSVWGWEIPVYLFLGGMVAGMMLISGYFLFKGRYKETNCSCYYLPIMSLVLLSVGMFALFLDLEHKLYVWRLYTTFQVTSAMSWGSWILILVYPILLANMLMSPHKLIVEKVPIVKKWQEYLLSKPLLIKNLGVVTMFFGAGIGLYTGVLLSSLGARPLWSSAVLWLLFLISGLSGAAAFVHVIAKNVYERELLAKADNAFLIIELFIIALFIIGLKTATEVQAHAADLLLFGEFASSFWVFVIGIGIIIPLIIQLLAVNHKIHHTPIAPLLVIIGGLILRFIIVAAGQYSHWFALN